MSKSSSILCWTRSISLVASWLFCSVVFPFKVQCQTDIDSKIASLREIINKNDALLTAPVGWHWANDDLGNMGVVPDGPDLGVAAAVSAIYQVKDPVLQLQGMDPRDVAGDPIQRAFGPKFTYRCSELSRIPALKGYVMTSCTARDVTDDSLHWRWFGANGYSVEQLSFVAPTQALFNRYLPVAQKWVDIFLARRVVTYNQQRSLAILLGVKDASCRDFGCR